jgi:prophage DNA circulation protein
MPWQDKVNRPAKFRGVPFWVESAELSTGRRGPIHEFAQRNDAFPEDMGRATRSFPVEGHVVGAEYIAARDALLKALESDDGPGELVHPYFGTLRVVVRSVRVRESPRDGGMSVFSIEFVESPAKPVQPTTVVDSAGTLRASADVARESTAAEFLAKYNPGPLLASVSEALRKVTLKVDNVLLKVSQTEQEAAAMARRVSRLRDSISTLVNEPADILASLTDLFDAFVGKSAPLVAIYAFDPGVRPPATTTNREQEQTNFDAVQRVVQRLALVRAAELAIDETFESYDQAIVVREAITDLLDEQAEDAADDTYPALLQLRADLTKAVPGESSDLAHLVSYAPVSNAPSLVVAYSLYGALDLESDLVVRNSVKHPGFVSGGEPLEVLSDE